MPEVMAASLTGLVLPLFFYLLRQVEGLSVLSGFYAAADRCRLTPSLPALEPCTLQSSFEGDLTHIFSSLE